MALKWNGDNEETVLNKIISILSSAGIGGDFTVQTAQLSGQPHIEKAGNSKEEYIAWMNKNISGLTIIGIDEDDIVAYFVREPLVQYSVASEITKIFMNTYILKKDGVLYKFEDNYQSVGTNYTINGVFSVGQISKLTYQSVSIITARRFERFWRKVKAWFVTQFSTVAKESAATANKDEVKQEIRDVAGSCVLPDFEEDVLASDKEDGYAGTYNDGDFVLDVDYSAEHYEDYQIGSIIHVGTLPQDEYDFAVAKSVDERTPQFEGQGLHLDENDNIQGVTEALTIQAGHYYRVTGVFDCYNYYCTEVERHIFTYEEVDPATITDMGKKIVEKLDGLDVHDENAAQLAQFFGIEGSFEAEAKGGERTNNTVIDECKVRFQDAFNGLLPTGFTMPNSVTVDNLTYTGTTNS